MLEPSGGVQRLSISYELGQDDFLLKPHSVDVMGVDSGVLTGFCTKETSRMFLTFFLAPKHFMTQLLESSQGIHWLPMLQEHRLCNFSMNWWFSSNVLDTKGHSVTQLLSVSIANAQIWYSCIGTYPSLVVQHVGDDAEAPTVTQRSTWCFFDENMRFLDDSNSLTIEISMKYPPGICRNSIFLHSCISMMPWGSARDICAPETALNTV